MRPIKRGASPIQVDFTKFADAKPYLISRLGNYCSYCERKVETVFAVEHIQPQSLYAHLIGEWTNFLLACVNCNSTKLNKNVALSDIFLPDRDNTLYVFEYLSDGRVTPSEAIIGTPLESIAKSTLALTGLDKKINVVLGDNGQEIAIDRVAQRIEAWLVAEDTKSDVLANPTEAVIRGAIRTAKACGFFSVWMTVFANHLDMRNRLIDAFAGTRGSGCFEPVTTQLISPSPNLDNLPDGGKI